MAAQRGAAPGGARDRSKALCRSALERWGGARAPERLGGARAHLRIALGQCGAHPLSWRTVLPVYSVRGRCGPEPHVRAAPPMPGGGRGPVGGLGGLRGVGRGGSRPVNRAGAGAGAGRGGRQRPLTAMTHGACTRGRRGKAWTPAAYGGSLCQPRVFPSAATAAHLGGVGYL